jgi:hypothetical protein
MALDPNISLGVKPIQLADPLAQYGQVAAIQAAQNQNQVSQMQMQRMRQTDAALEQVRQVAIKNGGPSDLNEIASAYMGAPDVEMQKFGVGLLQKLKERADFNEFGKKNYPELFGGASAATPPPVNAMAPAAAAPNVAPVNAMAAAPTSEPYPGYNRDIGMTPSVNAMAAPTRAQQLSPSGKTRQQLEGLIYMAQGNPLYKGMAETAKLELAEMIKPPVRQTVSPGSTVLGPDNQVIYIAPDAPSALSRLQTEMAKLPPGDPRRAQYIARINKESTHAPAVSVSMTQEKAEAADYGKLLVDQFKTVNESARIAARSLPAIESNLSTMNRDFDTGFGTETKAAGARVLAALGVKDADKYATDAQTFLANANSAVLTKQLEQKGPQTESDAQRITTTGAQLGNTKDANKFVLNVAKAQLRRDIDQRDFYADWRANSKTKSLEGAEDAWYKGEGGKSLFSRPELKAYAPKTSAAEQIPGQRPAGGVSVLLPNGQSASFPNAAAAAQFRKDAGL